MDTNAGDPEFNDLLADFAKRHNIENLVAEDSSAALDIDGIVTTLVNANGIVAIAADIGEPPAEGAAAFADLLLEANLESSAFFAKSRESGAYMLMRRLPLAGLDGDAFDLELEDFVNRVETWRRLLKDYRPAAKAASEQESELPSFGATGFMQV